MNSARAPATGQRRQPTPRPAIPARDLALGLIAGGRARRLGGRDKAWLERDGQPQVLRLAARHAPCAGEVLVSANRDLDRYEAAGLRPVPDRVADAGPLAALDALAAACERAWLLTLPVDIVEAPADLAATLAAGRSASGARVRDEEGVQPLAALWRVDVLREAAAAALAADDRAVHALQARLGLAEVRLPGVRLGNLNTPDDLRAAGFQVQGP